MLESIFITGVLLQPGWRGPSQQKILESACRNDCLNPFMWYAYKKGFNMELACLSTIKALIVSIEISILCGARENITSIMCNGTQQMTKKRTVMRSTIVVLISRIFRSPICRGRSFIINHELQMDESTYVQCQSTLSWLWLRMILLWIWKKFIYMFSYLSIEKITLDKVWQVPF